MQAFYTHHINSIVGVMMDLVPLRHILVKILQAGDNLGSARGILQSITSTMQHQRTVLRHTSKALWDDGQMLVKRSVELRSAAIRCTTNGVSALFVHSLPVLSACNFRRPAFIGRHALKRPPVSHKARRGSHL